MPTAVRAMLTVAEVVPVQARLQRAVFEIRDIVVSIVVALTLAVTFSSWVKLQFELALISQWK
jgi:hypothetical protein